MKTRFYTVYLSVLALLLVTSCVSLRSAVFDQYSYQKGTEIKVEPEPKIEVEKVEEFSPENTVEEVQVAPNTGNTRFEVEDDGAY